MTNKSYQRVLSASFYLLTWAKVLTFGKLFFDQYPSLQVIIIPALPILYIEKFLPLGDTILFVILFFYVVRNSNLAYCIRFNAMQSILLNICIIILNYGLQILFVPIININFIYQCIFISFLSIVIFCIHESLIGKEPEIPFISNAAKLQL